MYFTHTHTVQGQRGFPGPAGGPGAPGSGVSEHVTFCPLAY